MRFTQDNSTAPTLEEQAPLVVEPRIVVAVPDDKTKRQVSAVLQRGADATLLDSLYSYLRDRSSSGATARVGHATEHRNAGTNASSVMGLGRNLRPAEVRLLSNEGIASRSELASINYDGDVSKHTHRRALVFHGENVFIRVMSGYGKLELHEQQLI